MRWTGRGGGGGGGEGRLGEEGEEKGREEKRTHEG